MQFSRARIVCLLVLLALAASRPTLAQSARKDGAPASHSISATSFDVDPPGLLYQGVPADIPQDEGMAGLRLELLRLGTTARLMQVVAHPDDEDGGMLTLEARGRGVSTLLMTLNRGEGGQNKIGSNLSDVLGVLRAEELLASDSITACRKDFRGWRILDFRNRRRKHFRSGVGTIRRCRTGAGDSDVSSGCAGGAVFGDGAGWARASSGIEHSGEGGVSGGG